MAPSATPPELAPAAALERLDGIERRWRDALSFLAADDPQAAAKEIERAGEILQHLGRPDEAAELLAPHALAAFTDRMQRLSRLHRELLAASRRAQESIGRSLAHARGGRAALKVYGADPAATHACDETV